jgi:hypothetical protein
MIMWLLLLLLLVLLGRIPRAQSLLLVVVLLH